ncbi:precorrin-2/cobalt-factor-2 C20-methyltransferase [Tenacibaculum sp. MAR_2009_124]|uniref:precorrin-2 C(20)-methyltransferase n=1 Tax=Tenacibaculum sp. MAR_2009_124 TaxID=1250059 RepID=UPI0008973F6A|nr:precorrin-2 C(20)-methyltransferase [Tenacibaculum sp. MAR_2009_124]SEB85807.1 precorrin-2/cobalt-factor-2 C20-methyltransferase [Tenacibaculum sp. MAR_2009_124]
MVYGVALGPGDPELLTIKALRVLQESDVIFYPGSSFQGKKKSYLFPLLSYHNLENKDLRGFYLDMSDDRTRAKEVYHIVATEIKELVNAGKKVSVVCEGDISLYASFSYILNHLKKIDVSVELIPGINSFSLGAAKHQIPLSLLNDKILIVPRIKSMEEITKYFRQVDTLVLMKVKTSWKYFYKELSEQNWNFYYCERLGTNEEYITTDLEKISSREIPYFSLLIIKKNHIHD